MSYQSKWKNHEVSADRTKDVRQRTDAHTSFDANSRGDFDSAKKLSKTPSSHYFRILNEVSCRSKHAQLEVKMTVGEKFEKLVGIMTHLRSPAGCIWDREQTHGSLRQYLLEEAYEVLEAIDRKDLQELCKELGDVLLQVVFHAQIASEAKRFDIGKVIEGITDKMIRRHPHVFGEARVNSVAEQIVHWEELKKQEGKKSSLEGIPEALPALQHAARLQQKANVPAQSWNELLPAMQAFTTKVEMPQDKISTHEHHLQEAYGDLLFTIVSAGRGLGLNAEDALREACQRFSRKLLETEKDVANDFASC
jgi:tetrapyrrole methylase family protein/MazG family protein